MISEQLMQQATYQHQSELNKMKSLSYEDIKAGLIASAPSVAAELFRGVTVLNQVHEHYKEADPLCLHGKFSADPGSFSYTYGGMEVHHGGLEGCVGKPSPNIMEALQRSSGIILTHFMRI
jgi:hypothetical protein